MMDLLSAFCAVLHWWRGGALLRQGAARQQAADQAEVIGALQREEQALQTVANAPDALECALRKGEG
jgi:hypothetical protein